MGHLTQGANRPASSEGKRKGDAILTTLGRSEDLWEIFTVAKLLIILARVALKPMVVTRGAEAVTRGEPPGEEPTAIVEVGQLARALDDAAMAIRERDREKERLLGEARAARREAEGLNRAKDEFLAMLGHELRNPLGAISNAVYVLGHVGPAEDSEEGRALKIIARQSAHLARLVDDLLDLGRLTTGKILLNREPTDLAEIVRRVAATVVATRRLHHVTFAADTDSVWIEADVVRIEQVIENLLSNAAKFTPAGGQIRVTAGRKGSEAVVRVNDTGAGIDERLLPRVFDLFVQGSVERRGIVEDNANSRDMLKALFALEGHEVYEAVDGPSAIEAMAREHPDIALIDIGLPGIDGYEVASRVRAQPHGADVFLVALTGYGLGADRERSREAGFDVHLVKPFHPGELKKIFAHSKPRSGQPSPS